MKSLGTWGWTSLTLVVIAGLNYGLISLFRYDLLTTLFGAGTVVERIIYGIIGLAALYMVYHCYNCCKK